MTKKKVSFDIDPHLLSDIKKFCENKGINLAYFFRTASSEKLERDKDYMIIYIPYNGKIEKFSIQISDYEIDINEASENMRINVDAICEGIIRKKNSSNNSLDELIRVSSENKLHFFTKEMYC